MASSFSFIDIQLIKSLWEKHPPRYIAMILAKPILDVEKQISIMDKTGVKLCPVPTIDIVKRDKDTLNWAKQIKREEVKPKDFSGLHAVRIDRNTIVLVRPDADIEAIKSKYRRKTIQELINEPI